jgi:ATP-dependent Clp protease protease subunit
MSKVSNSTMPTQDLDPEKSPSQLLQDNGMYVFMGEVDEDSIRPIIEWILVENHVVKKKKKELLLMICSSGGSLESAFALIDVMRASSIYIKTVGLGQIASAGLMIFLAGSPGRRVLTPNTSILSHQYSWGSDGKHHELFAVTKEFDLVQRRMMAHYQHSTGLSEDIIKTKLLPPSDVWLSAEEAMSLGVCDYISDLTQR